VLDPGVRNEPVVFFSDADSQLRLDPLLGEKRAQGQGSRHAEHGIQVMPGGDVDRTDPKRDRAFPEGSGDSVAAVEGGGHRGEAP
jgi:hypothetical protein